MRTTIETKRLATLTKAELKRVKQLTLKGKELPKNCFSLMYKSVIATDQRNKSVVLVRDEEDIIGWALLHKFVLGIIDKPKPHNVWEVELHVYVEPKHRRKGIGKKIVAKAKSLKRKLWPGIKMRPERWNNVSSKFYDKVW